MLRTMTAAAISAILAVTMAPAAMAQTPPAAVIADQAPDREHPARLVQVRYETGAVEVPARLFVASGAGAHPTVLLLHGFPGTELNLDIARAVQRAGWNVLAIHYRGVWGAPGQFSFSHTTEDARAALAWLRSPENAQKHGVDPTRIVVLGHSMGGFDTVMIGDDPGVAGFVVVSPADIGGRRARQIAEDRAGAQASYADDLSYTNASFDAIAEDILTHAESWDWATNAAEMGGRPVLIFNSNDGLESAGHAIREAVTAAGGPAPTEIKFETDHSYNDHRIALQSAIVTWLEEAF